MKTIRFNRIINALFNHIELSFDRVKLFRKKKKSNQTVYCI